MAQSTKAEFAQMAQSTKAEFAQMAQSTKAEFLAVRSEFTKLEQRMTIKLGGLMVAATGLILAAIRVMH